MNSRSYLAGCLRRAGFSLSTSLLLLVVPGCNRQPPVRSKQDSGPVKVRTLSVAAREIQRNVESVGTLFPYEEVIISSEIEGRVEQVNADHGDRVAPGQIGRAHV